MAHISIHLLSLYLLALTCAWRQDAEAANEWEIISRYSRRHTSTTEPPAYQKQRQNVLLSPVQIGTAKFASQLFNGRPELAGPGELQVVADFQGNVMARDMFRCVEPTRQLFDRFVESFKASNRFHDNTEELERLGLFTTTLRRTIMLNRIIQSEILNETNYHSGKRAIGNYYFIAPLGDANVAPWYADITDCELGLVKYHLFHIFDLIDTNQLTEAYKVALKNKEHLPLLDEQGFEQLANILLIRLYDRFVGDQMMDQLFRWPHYLKALSAFAYNRRQAAQPNYITRLRLISFAYPNFYKDLKYNPMALNRTGDNWEVSDGHEQFNKLHKRQFSDLREKNKRLQIFRQRWTLTSQLYDTDRWNLTLVSENEGDTLRPIQVMPDWNWNASASIGNHRGPMSERLRVEGEDGFWQVISEVDRKLRARRTQFSDLTDAEFVAYLNNDFSALEPSSAQYLERNFNEVRHLSEELKSELATELEMRRMSFHWAESHITCYKRKLQEDNQPTLERQVIEELIADVGLPIGPVSVDGIKEDEYHEKFIKVGRFFGKSYLAARDTETADERQRRYEQFKANYGRFKAWHIKEGWEGEDESRILAMLRLADLSWHEIKVLLFRVCCLTEANLALLSSENATINYMGSHQYLCQPLNVDPISNFEEPEVNKARTTTDLKPDLAALELYYYYSVHFNKHHSQMDLFNRHFAIFKHNIDSIRRHTCTRGLSLFRSLQRKQADTLSTIDVLDARRARTDDLNLDRFRYFSVPDLTDNSPPPSFEEDRKAASATLARLKAQREKDTDVTTAGARPSDSSPSRAGISYRRESLFSGLLDTRGSPEAEEWTTVGGNQTLAAVKAVRSSYSMRLIMRAQDQERQALEYSRRSADKIYDFVQNRYRFCLKLAHVRDPNPDKPKRCHSAGPLAEQSNVWLTDQLSSSESQKLQLTEQCSYYWMGLQFWDAGLIKQDVLSVRLIQSAKC